MAKSYKWQGLYPATVLPMNKNFSIDEPDLRRLIRFLKGIKGVSGLACNGHAGDCWAITPKERRRIIDIHIEEAAGKIPIIAGLTPECTREAIEGAKEAKAAGASAVLVMPPGIFRNIAVQGSDAPYAFFSEIANAVDIPIVIFQHPVYRQNNYNAATLVKLTEIKNIVAVKDAVWDFKLYERDLMALLKAPRRISILVANDTFLYPSFCLGDSDGALIGFGTLAPHWMVDMYEAVKRGDLKRGQEINSRIFPIVELLYHTPGLNAHAAIKEALYMLGVLTKPCVSRSPQRAVTEKEKEILRNALAQSGLAEFYKKLDLEA
jgi:4-hydroxy-tetrahydrodipicolinate synthase